MGIAIGQTPAQVSAARAVTPPRDAAAQPRGTDAGPAGDSDVRAGFGANTISSAAAALVTLDSNLERAREIVPTVEELRAELREARARAAEQFRADQAEEQIARATTPPEELGFDNQASPDRPETVSSAETLPPPTAFRPESAPQVRAFTQFESEVTQRPAPEAPNLESGNVPGLPPSPQTRLDVLI